MSVDEHLSSGKPAENFAGLRGFQFVGATAGPSGESSPMDEQGLAALTLELDARAARFHQAVDSSIVLASDGGFRWLGDSIAKLTAGDDLLAPRTILLVDAAISADARKMIEARLELWIHAMIRRLLGPLFSLRAMQEGSRELRELAGKVANALGVLDREPIRSIVRRLDQDSRAVLRKQGVRFGSYYLYVPSTLRPASRALALQLWCIQKGEGEFNEAAQGLMMMTSSGRTSAPPDLRLNRETYRVGGFRSCGDRVVRVDIVERLADLIRAASTLRIANASDSGRPAFLANSQMTSLTGCSGESFSSILRALGFESVTVQRREIVWPAASAPVSVGPGDLGSPPAAVSEAESEHAGEPEVLNDAPPPGDICDDARPAVGTSLSEPENSSPDAEPASSAARGAAQLGAESEISALPEESTISVGEEAVTIWRLARLETPKRQRRARPSPTQFSVTEEQHGEQRQVKEGAARVAAGLERSTESPSIEDKRAGKPEKPPKGGKGKFWDTARTKGTNDDKSRERKSPDGPSSGERKHAVDPLSPFAKLMELRATLGSASKKRS